MSTHDVGPKIGPRLVLLIAAAALLHLAVLGGADWVWPSNAPPPVPAPSSASAPVFEVRALAATQPALVAAPPRPSPLVVPSLPAPKPATVGRRAPVTDAPASTRRDAPVPVATQATDSAAAAAPAAAAASASASEEVDTIPLYRTRLPPAATLRFELRRGALRGIGELAWRPQGERYEIQLDFQLSGLTILSQLSTGSLDAAGIAPLRFTDRRARRGTSAANFQREKGTITYSGSAREFAWMPGAQDRLSWMLQLAAIVSAEPQRAAAGARVVMQVTGARADAGIWVFRCLGTESIESRGGAIDALRFVREAREPYDTTVQIWLDPKRHHLPVRASQNALGSDQVEELRLLELTTPG